MGIGADAVVGGTDDAQARVPPFIDLLRRQHRVGTLHAENEAERIKELIEKHAPHWSMERMAAVDRNVIRTGVAEFLGFRTPRAIVVNEALEIARKYSSEDSIQFINGVLDSVGKTLGRR